MDSWPNTHAWYTWSHPYIDATTPAEYPWTLDAICQQTDPELFFPEKGDNTEVAKQLCSTCPVTHDCLEEALARDERYGVWGGLSASQRKLLKRQRRLGDAA